MSQNQVATTISKLRKAKGLSQYELAQRAGLTQRVITYYENEAKTISIQKIEKIAAALDAPVAQLLGNTKLAVSKVGDEQTFDVRTMNRLKKMLLLSRQERLTVYQLIDSLVDKKSQRKNRAHPISD